MTKEIKKIVPVDTDNDGTPDACDDCAVGDADNDGFLL